MKVTFIIKDRNKYFFEGFKDPEGNALIQSFNEMDLKIKFLHLVKMSYADDSGITSKVGNDSFRDKVEFNSNKNKQIKEYKLEKRKGYLLATFIWDMKK